MRQNLFKLPSGGPGKDFVREISRLLSAWNSKSNLKVIAWKCIMVMPTLLLQKPSASSKSRDHKAALQRRLILWQKGDLKELIQECETLQKRLKDSLPSRSIEAISKKFSNLMKKGKTTAAVKLLSSNMQGGVLPLNEETKKLLLEKNHLQSHTRLWLKASLKKFTQKFLKRLMVNQPGKQIWLQKEVQDPLV